MGPLFTGKESRVIAHPLIRRLRVTFVMKHVTQADVEAKLKSFCNGNTQSDTYRHIESELWSEVDMSFNFFCFMLKIMFDMTAEQIDAVLREDYIAAGISSEVEQIMPLRYVLRYQFSTDDPRFNTEKSIMKGTYVLVMAFLPGNILDGSVELPVTLSMKVDLPSQKFQARMEEIPPNLGS